MEAPFKSSTLFGFSVKHHPFWIPPFIENPMCISERGIHRGFGLFSISDDLSELSQKKEWRVYGDYESLDLECPPFLDTSGNRGQ